MSDTKDTKDIKQEKPTEKIVPKPEWDPDPLDPRFPKIKEESPEKDKPA